MKEIKDEKKENWWWVKMKEQVLKRVLSDWVGSRTSAVAGSGENNGAVDISKDQRRYRREMSGEKFAGGKKKRRKNERQSWWKKATNNVCIFFPFGCDGFSLSLVSLRQFEWTDFYKHSKWSFSFIDSQVFCPFILRSPDDGRFFFWALNRQQSLGQVLYGLNLQCARIELSVCVWIKNFQCECGLIFLCPY